MKYAFKEMQFQAKSQALITKCNEIVDIYAAQRLRLTLRQLYYQLVTQNIIPNQERSYKALGSLVSNARLAGQIDWDAIEDRVRVPRKPSEFRNLKDLVDAALYSYRLPRWSGQKEYVELWVEKDALSGVLAPMASEYHVTLMVNRGYSSQSAMYEAAQRFNEHGGQGCTLLYLGDHDPSGEDMVRDIQDRLDLMAQDTTVEVIKIALTSSQVSQYNPPPNPTKHSDTRSPGYIAKHGEECWEVDALRPDVLHGIVEQAILEHVDLELMDTIKRQEIKDKARLTSFVGGIKD